MHASSRPVSSSTEIPRTANVPVETPRSYWQRLRRAVTVLMAAVAAHVWLVPAHRTAPQLPVQQTVEVATAAAVRTAPAARPVRLRIDEVIVPVGTMPPGIDAHVAADGPSKAVAGARPIPVALVAAPPPSSSFGTDPALLEPVGTSGMGPETGPMPDAEEVPLAATLRPAPPSLPIGDLAPAAFRVVPLDGPLSYTVPRSAAPAADDTELQQKNVLEVLHRYRRAFEKLDVRAAKAIYPTLDARALQRAFRDIDAQQMQFARCDMLIKGRDADASCLGEATYRPKVGSRLVRVTEREWKFNLSRDDAGWQIVNATIQ